MRGKTSRGNMCEGISGKQKVALRNVALYSLSMKKIFYVLGSVLFVAGCSANMETVKNTFVVSSSSSPAPAVIEPYPSEFSVEHFKKMALSGSDLVIGRVIESTSAWSKHFISYKSNGVKISGTLAMPKGEGPFTLIVLNHGYIDPKIYTNGRGLRREQDAIARAGFAVLHTDYRKHAQSDPDPDTRNIYDNALAYALDSANAVLAVRNAQPAKIDATKVGMMGHSMGGGVTMHLLVAHPEVIDAAVLYAPISPDAWQNFERWRLDDREESTETLEALKTKAENPQPWLAMSQTGSLKDIEDPILLVHGLKDSDVPAEWSHALNATLDHLDKNIRYITYPKEGHEFSETWKHFIDTSIAFYKEHL